MKAPVAIPLPIARAMLHPFYRVVFDRRMPWSAQRALLNGVARFQPLPAGTFRRALPLGDRTAERIAVGEPGGSGAVLYLHGGGYTVGSIATHRSLAAHLARDTARPVYLLDYRLAPEHPYPAALDDTLAAFTSLAETEGHAPGDIALAGDSAGGGIALAAAIRLVAAGTDPAALALISPWANPGLVAERYRDVVVNRPWGLACAAAYLGAGDGTDPGYAPALGTLAGLPPTYVHAGARELLHDQIVSLAVALRRAGVRVRYAESPTLWHAGQAQAGMVRAAADSVRDVSRFLTEVWAST